MESSFPIIQEITLNISDTMYVSSLYSISLQFTSVTVSINYRPEFSHFQFSMRDFSNESQGSETSQKKTIIMCICENNVY